MPKNATQETPATTTPIDVAPDRSAALAAGYDGIYHLFGGRVSDWTLTEDGLIAQGFTVSAQYDVEKILTALAAHVRRAPLMPTLRWIMGGEAPADFENPQDVTTFTVQYFKGADGAEGSKVPEWVRSAAETYKKSRDGFYKQRGPKAKGIEFKNLRNLTPEALTNAKVEVDDLEHLVQMAQAAIAARQAQGDNSESTEAQVAVEA